MTLVCRIKATREIVRTSVSFRNWYEAMILSSLFLPDVNLIDTIQSELVYHKVTVNINFHSTNMPHFYQLNSRVYINYI